MQRTAVATAMELPLPHDSAKDECALHLCYREIGISAVAAAARYQGDAKNVAYAPAPIRLDEGQNSA
jgi:hypothetical protein